MTRELEAVELPYNTESNWLFIPDAVECGSIPAAVSAACRRARRAGVERFRMVFTASRKSTGAALMTIYGESLKERRKMSGASEYSVILNMYGEVIP